MFGHWKKQPVHWSVKILWGIGAIILGSGFVALLSFVAMSLWNAVIPQVIGWKALEFWQAVAFIVLVRILVGFPGRHGHRGPPWAHKHKRFNMEGMGPWAGHDGPEGFRNYRDFWKEEGRDAFEKFVEKRKNQESSEKI